jgi:predicted amidohydrolase
MRVAIAQLRMQWTGEGNTRAIVAALARAAAAQAQVCVFPELAVTGFHRQIRSQAEPGLVQAWMTAVQAACTAHAIAASVGVPTFDGDGRTFNSNVFIDAAGDCVGVVEKNGLTPAEATFFAPGTSRTVHRLLGRRCSALLCREIEDLDLVASHLPHGSTDLIFWPGAMRPAVDGSETDPDAHVKKAQTMARRTGAFLVQANWPNSLNYPEESEFAGQSVVISPVGVVLMRLPVAEAGLAVFTLGASKFDWQPQETA